MDTTVSLFESGGDVSLGQGNREEHTTDQLLNKVIEKRLEESLGFYGMSWVTLLLTPNRHPFISAEISPGLMTST